MLIKNCKKCSKQFKKLSSDSKLYWSKKEFCSTICSNQYNKGYKKLIGRKRPDEVKDKMKQTMFKKGSTPWNKDKPFYQLRGSRHPLWKGGITMEIKKIRNSLEFKLWRKAIFERDEYTCIWCNKKGGVLNADHIQLFSTHPELRFAIDNGRTLCKPCHIRRHSLEK